MRLHDLVFELAVRLLRGEVVEVLDSEAVLWSANRRSLSQLAEGVWLRVLVDVDTFDVAFGLATRIANTARPRGTTVTATSITELDTSEWPLSLPFDFPPE